MTDFLTVQGSKIITCIYDHIVFIAIGLVRNKLAVEAHAGNKFIKKRLMSFSFEKTPCLS